MIYARQTPTPDYDALLAAMDRRFSPDSTVRRPALETASPAPAEEVRRKYSIDQPEKVPAIASGASTANRKALWRACGPPKHFRPVVSPPAVSGCEHEWGPHSKKQARCVKCGKSRLKKLIPGLVLVRRPRPARFVLPPCTDSRGHRENWDGKTKAGARRIRCIRCEATRAATEAECAAKDWRPGK